MKEILTLSVALAMVCAVASGILAVAQFQTWDAREQARLRDRSRALEQILPPHTNVPLEDAVRFEHRGGSVIFFRARRDGDLVGIAGQAVSPHGFGGGIEVMVGIEPDGSVRTVVVTNHSETPGLGTMATDRARRKTIADVFGNDRRTDEDGDRLPPNRFLDDFEAYDLTVTTQFDIAQDGGELDAVSGATVSSRAVADAVTRVARVFTDHRETIVGE